MSLRVVSGLKRMVVRVPGPQGGPGLIWRGAWSSGTAYAVDDVVQRSGSAYVCTVAHTNHGPPNASYWDLLASKGDAGSGAGIVRVAFDFSAQLNGGLVDFELPVTGGQSLVADSVDLYVDGAWRAPGLGYTITGVTVTTIGAGVPLAAGQSLAGSFWETA